MAPPVIHSLALVETAAIGGGTRVWAFAHVMAGARVGRDCNIGDHAFIEAGAEIGDRVTLKNNVCVWAGVTLEDDVFVGPNVAFTNDRFPRSPRMNEVGVRYSSPDKWLETTVVGRGASIGANATILPGVRIGRYSMVAAGAVVTADVEPHALVVGAPARQVGHVCRCGRKLSESRPAVPCGYCGATPIDRNHARTSSRLSP